VEHIAVLVAEMVEMAIVVGAVVLVDIQEMVVLMVYLVLVAEAVAAELVLA
jgi:hypothetical protein